MKNKWEIIYECDDEEDNPTCWALEINHEKYGKYVWISKYDDNEYSVEVAYYYDIVLDEMKVLAECKSLASAKRWVSRYLLA